MFEYKFICESIIGNKQFLLSRTQKRRKLNDRYLVLKIIEIMSFAGKQWFWIFLFEKIAFLRQVQLTKGR